MAIALVFMLPDDPEQEVAVQERLRDIVELLNLDKDEQAIDPAFFAGNLEDYPAWLREAFGKPELQRRAEKLCGMEPNELNDWELEDWYEDLVSGQTWNFKLTTRDDARGWMFAYQTEGEHYGGDLPLVWILLAAGAQDLERIEAPEGPFSKSITGPLVDAKEMDEFLRRKGEEPNEDLR